MRWGRKYQVNSHNKLEPRVLERGTPAHPSVLCPKQMLHGSTKAYMLCSEGRAGPGSAQVFDRAGKVGKGCLPGHSGQAWAERPMAVGPWCASSSTSISRMPE